VGRAQGVTDAQIQELARYATSAAFDDVERLVIEYAEAMSRTPVHVGDALFAALRARFDHGQLVELTAAIAWENWRARFNHALEIDAAGFSEGAVCMLPETPRAG
jgi:alkylhydroperoxidase family enzyme